MKLGDLFHEEWECQISFSDPCWEADVRRGKKPFLHDRCGWRYAASLNEYEYEQLKDVKIL